MADMGDLAAVGLDDRLDAVGPFPARIEPEAANGKLLEADNLNFVFCGDRSSSGLS